MTSRTLLLVFAIVSLAFASREQEQQQCEYQTTDWQDCANGVQNRSLSCYCKDTDGQSVESHISMCSDLTSPDLTQSCDDDSLPPVCNWKWTRWSRCTKPCDGGNTTRKQVCVCQSEGDESPVTSDPSYCSLDDFFGNETAECNTFSCDDTPAFNKLYWVMRADEGHWPMPDKTFNCSVGYDVNGTSPKGKHYSTILRDSRAQTKPHPEWYYLAKEWIAARLNLANGVLFDEGTVELINTVGDLLEKCDGWVGKELFIVYSAKEKLGRINNNIGSLEHVDDQVAVIYGGEEGGSKEERDGRTFILVITIPGIAIVVVLLIAAATVYYVKRQREKVIEHTTFESEDDSEGAQDDKEGGDVPLSGAQQGGETFYNSDDEQ